MMGLERHGNKGAAAAVSGVVASGVVASGVVVVLSRRARPNANDGSSRAREIIIMVCGCVK